MLAAVLFSGDARAAFTVCNQTLDIANVAIATLPGAEGSGARSQGWWVVAPNRCAEIEPEDLGDERWHVFAVDVRGEVLVDGGEPFCTAPKSFNIQGRGDCWLRGHTKGNFSAVETEGARDWTVFLRDRARGNGN